MISRDLSLIIFSYFSHSQVRELGLVSDTWNKIITNYSIRKLSQNPIFDGMEEEEMIRYFKEAEVALNNPDGSSSEIDPLFQKVIAAKIYYSDHLEFIEPSFIDIDNKVYIELTLIPEVTGTSISRIIDCGDNTVYLVTCLNGTIYCHSEWGGDCCNIITIANSGPLIITDCGTLMVYNGYDTNIFLEVKSDRNLPKFRAVATEHVDPTCSYIYRFFVYLRDSEERNWMMLLDDLSVIYFVSVDHKKKIKDVITNDVGAAEQFIVLFQDGTIELMSLTEENRSLNIIFTEITSSVMITELDHNKASLYDQENNEYYIVDNDLLETGYSKWNSVCDVYMIDY